MTVEELISILQTLPQNLRVVVNMGRSELGNGREAGEVKVESALKYSQSSKNWSSDFYPEEPCDEDDIREAVVNIANG